MQARNSGDPFLAQRRRTAAILVTGERKAYAGLIVAMTRWLDATRALILGQPVDALTAAATPDAGDLDNARAAFTVWARALIENVEPVLEEAFGEGFRQQSRVADISPVHYQEEHMRTVHDRLVIWPEGAFEELRPELLEAMAEGEDYEQIQDRIGRILNIDALSRRIRADINDIDRQLADPETPSAEIAGLKGKRRQLWSQHDESLLEWQWKARRIARTEIHGAMQAGTWAAAQASAQATGKKMYKAWLATSDERTRVEHVVAEGQMVPLETSFSVAGYPMMFPGDPFAPGHLSINCVIGSTKLGWPGQGVLDSTRRRYRGTLVHLRTVRGHDLAITPNHPVLTTVGYVPAHLLRPGQHVLATGGPGAPQVGDVPASAEQFHTALREAGMEQRVIGRTVDFHGDGTADDEVEVVRPHRDLKVDRPERGEGVVEQLDLVHLEHRSSPLASLRSDVGPLATSLQRGGDVTTSRDVGGSSQLPPLVWGEALHPDPVGLTGSSDGQPQFVKPADDDGSADAELVRHLLHAHAVGMTPCEVVQVEHLTGNHDVFNLSTTDEWYIANGIALHNCRCSMRILTEAEMQAELQGQWGGRGVGPGNARLGPDLNDDVTLAMEKWKQEQRGEVVGDNRPPWQVERDEKREAPTERNPGWTDDAFGPPKDEPSTPEPDVDPDDDEDDPFAEHDALFDDDPDDEQPIDEPDELDDDPDPLADFGPLDPTIADGTDDVAAAVNRADVHDYPKHLRQRLQEADVAVEIADTIPQAPAGAFLAEDDVDDGRPWDTVGGVYLNYGDQGGAVILTGVEHGSENVAFHELSHAVDDKYLHGQPLTVEWQEQGARHLPESIRPAVQQPYRHRITRVTDDPYLEWAHKIVFAEKKADDYYVTGSTGDERSGRDEWFAESLAAFLVGTTAKLLEVSGGNRRVVDVLTWTFRRILKL